MVYSTSSACGVLRAVCASAARSTTNPSATTKPPTEEYGLTVRLVHATTDRIRTITNLHLTGGGGAAYKTATSITGARVLQGGVNSWAPEKMAAGSHGIPGIVGAHAARYPVWTVIEDAEILYAA